MICFPRRGSRPTPAPPPRPVAWCCALLAGGLCWWSLILPSARADTPPAAPEAIRSIHEFYTGEGNRPRRIDWELDILYYDPDWDLLWVHNNGTASYIQPDRKLPGIAAGQRVRAEGEMVRAQPLSLRDVTLAPLPAGPAIVPLVATGHIAEPGRFDDRLVTLEAVVDRQSEPDATHLLLEASAEGLHVAVRVRVDPQAARPRFEGKIIQATGVYVGHRNFAGALTSVALWVPDLNGVTSCGSLDDDPAFAAPVVRIDEIATRFGGQQVHLVGTVHAFDSTAATVTLRDTTGQVVVCTAQTHNLRLGQELEAVGRVETAGVQHRLLGARIRPLVGQRRPLGPPALVSPAGQLRLADQILELKPDDADRGHSVQLFGVATWMAPDRTTLFLQDMTGGVEVRLPSVAKHPPILPCTVQVDGRTARGAYAPVVDAAAIVWNNPIGSPEPRRATLDEMLTGTLHGIWIDTRAYLRAVHREPDALRLDLTTASGDFVATLPPGETIDALPGSMVGIRGVCCVTANERRQLAGVRLLIPAARHLVVEQRAPADPFTLPMRSIAGLREFGASDSAPGRVCTVGTVLYHEPGRFICLQDGNDTLLALAHDSTALHPGDRVEVVGLPGREGGRLVLREAVYRRTGKADEPAPTDLLHPETPDAALDGRLVRLTGIVTGVRRQAAEAFVAVRSGQRIFEASFVAAKFDPERCAEGSTVTLQGVYRAIYDEYRQPIDFTLRLRSRHDIAVLHAPPLWTVSRALTAAGILCLLTAAVLGWLAVLRARVAKQTAQIHAQLAHQSRLEADLQKAQRIESLGLLAGGIAHDFNNLLTGILGNLGLAKLDETASAAVGDCLTEAEYAALRARDLTQRLMVFTKGSPSVRSVVRLPPLVRESATFVLHGATIRCEFDLPDDLWFANVDRVQIGQVVQNLAINAAQAMPLGGTLHLALANEVVAPGFRADLAPGRYIRLTATDGGGGIPAELLPKIFDPYFTTKKTGNGLGLATVYSIVRRHGGHIEAESAPGRGTTFRVWLPAADVGQVPEEPGLDYVPALAGPAAPFAARVLLMDDEVAIRRTVAVALFRAGYEVTTTADGREAVEEFITAEKQGRPYRLVLLDLTVPGGLGGREAMAAIRNLAPQVRAIVSTGYGNDPAFTAYRDHGFDAALAKPYELKELLARVAETLADGPP